MKRKTIYSVRFPFTEARTQLVQTFVSWFDHWFLKKESKKSRHWFAIAANIAAPLVDRSCEKAD
jgi:hypothetical protein